MDPTLTPTPTLTLETDFLNFDNPFLFFFKF